VNPRATYRLQFTKSFTFEHATALVPYLARLGISHLYSSPILTARAGSTHCYDIVDHSTINPELGGMPALRHLTETLHAHDMGLLVDIVPNHMGIAGSENRLWLDVLEWGRASPYAGWFDIDWEPQEPRLRGRVLLPFLGDTYGTVLAEGSIALRLDRATGSLSAWHHEHRLPIAPRDYGEVLCSAHGRVRTLDAALDRLSRVGRVAGARGSRALRRTFQDSRAEFARFLATDTAARTAVDEALSTFDCSTAAGQARLHQLLERQNYRLAWWRAAADEVNYRRFFNVNELAGFRVEVGPAFDASHALLLTLWRVGMIDGMRIDHVDGLGDPRGYCRKLRRRMEALARHRPPGRSREPWIVVEKILARHERLPSGWRVDGTTGYEFMDAVSAVLHDPKGEAPLTALHAEITGNTASFREHELVARRQILRDYLAAELAGVALVVHRILQRDPVTRDFTLTGVRRALAEVAAHFPVYRTYCSEAGPNPEDRRVLGWAVQAARRTLRPAEWPLFDALLPILEGSRIRHMPLGATRRDGLLALRRFQQLTGPTAAKSVEDTAFYRFARLLSRNEVGADPGQFALPAAAFGRMQRHLRRTPFTLLATATHDHKRGEDGRARLAVLSEQPTAWATAVRRWLRLNAPLKVSVDNAPAPVPTDEYQLYQTLVSA